MSYSSHSPEQRLQRVQALFPGSAFYLQNKWRGGHNGRKGADYERRYAVFALARVLVEHCMLPKVQRWPALYEQVEAVVDDLLVETADGARYHQLKNVQALSWGDGQKSLHMDFKMQKTLSDSLGEQATTVLVVADSTLADRLKRSLPQDIAGHTEVEFFPFCDGSINRLVLEHSAFGEFLAQLSVTACPTPDELVSVCSALMIALERRETGGPADDFLRLAQDQSPQLIRLLPGQAESIQIDDALESILDDIPGFHFSVERGFFEWSCNNDSGVLRYSCLTNSFIKLQKMIIKANPKTFEELEEFLL